MTPPLPSGTRVMHAPSKHRAFVLDTFILDYVPNYVLRHILRHMSGFFMAVMLVGLSSSVFAAPAQTIAVFQCELFDTSGDVMEESLRAQPRRLREITTILREAVNASDQYEVVAMDNLSQLDSPYARFADEGLFSECNGCEADVARLIGAQISMGCLVQKVSNLILNLNLYLRDTSTGDLVELFNASIRGNDDTSWRRSMLWLIRNRLFEDPVLKEERRQRLRGEMPPTPPQTP